MKLGGREGACGAIRPGMEPRQGLGMHDWGPSLPISLTEGTSLPCVSAPTAAPAVHWLSPQPPSGPRGPESEQRAWWAPRSPLPARGAGSPRELSHGGPGPGRLVI